MGLAVKKLFPDPLSKERARWRARAHGELGATCAPGPPGLGISRGVSALCWLQSAAEAFWKLRSSGMAASSFLPLARARPKEPCFCSHSCCQAFREGVGGGPLPAWVGQARQLPSLLAAESLPGCTAQGPGSVTGNISYYNAELGTQSLLKINTKENPKVAKPISIPFIFLVPGSFVFSLQLWRRISYGAHPEC